MQYGERERPGLPRNSFLSSCRSLTLPVLLTFLGSHRSFFDRHIALLTLSHPNLDHLGEFPEILRRYDVDAILLAGSTAHLPQYQEILAILARSHVKTIIAQPGMHLSMGDGVAINVLWPPRDRLFTPTQKLNDVSVIFSLAANRKSALFTGDIEESGEKEILQGGSDVRADVLKVAHHGSKTSSGTGFLLAVHPTRAVISVGADNTYGHPNISTLTRFKELRIPTQRTDIDGTVHMQF
jgi:competence protein ComEC